MKGDIAVYQILKADATVSSLASVYPYIAPEELSTAFIVVNLEDTTPYHTKETTSKVDVDSVLVSIVTTSLDTSVTINDAVRSALDGYKGTITLSDASTIVVDRAWLESIGSDLFKESSRTVYVIESTYSLRIKRTDVNNL